MRKVVWSLLWLTMVVTNTGAQPLANAEEPHTIFRHITAGDGKKMIKLGEPLLADVTPLLDKAEEGRYRLRKGTVGGAESIEVFVTKEGRVKAIFFGYTDGTDYMATREIYQGTLGKPQRIEEQ